MSAYESAKESAIREARRIVDEQAKDEGLWGLNLDGSQNIVEAHLQQELRRLHAAVEAIDVAALSAVEADLRRKDEALADIATRQWRDEGGRIAAAVARDGLTPVSPSEPVPQQAEEGTA